MGDKEKIDAQVVEFICTSMLL